MKVLLLALLLVAQRPASPALQVGTVIGRLLNEDGSPAGKVRVSAMSIPDNKSEAPTLMTLAETDTNGRYRLTDVPVGRYYIVAGFVDSPTYYPRGTGTAGATAVNVTANATVANIDFRIEKPSTGVTVSGRVIVESNQPPGSVQVILNGGNANGGYTNLNVPIKLDGSFEFVRVRSGTYSIQANPSPMPETRTIVVADKDLTGLELRIPWTTEVTGRVVVEGSGPVPAFSMSFSGGMRAITAYNQGVNQPFRATLAEGFYAFTTTNLPSGFFLKSITSGSIDLLSSPLRVAKTELPAEIVVTLGVSTPPPWVRLTGRVIGSRQAARTITAYGSGGNLTTPVAADGTFEFAKILPGSYNISFTPGNPALPSQLLLLVPSRDMSGVELKLPTVRDISGRIVVEDGGPLPRAMLTLTARAEEPKQPDRSTAPTLPQLLVTMANFRGGSMSISLAVQQDGTFVASVPEGQYQAIATIPAYGGATPYAVKSFTYGSRDLSREPLTISSTGNDEMRVTFSPLSPNAWAKVSGKVVGLPSMAPNEMPSVSLNNPLFVISPTAIVRPDGTFEFPRVYSGNYWALLNGTISRTGSGIALSEVVAPVEANLGNSDLSGVDFVVPGLKEISGRIILEGRGALPRLAIPITAFSAAPGTPTGRMSSLNIAPQTDGTFKVTVPVGERQIGQQISTPPGYRLKSLQYGSADLGSAPLKVSATDTAELRVTLTTPDLPPVKVSGKVSGIDALTFSRGPVIVRLNEPRYITNLQATVAPDGAFEFAAVFPGNYSVGISPATGVDTPTIIVGTKDLTGIEIRVPRQKEISGRMILEGSGPMPRVTVPLYANAAGAGATGNQSLLSINPQPDGTFRVNVQEGERRVGPPSSIPVGYAIKTMTYGSVDVLSAPMKITAGDTDELRITMSTPNVLPVKISGRVSGLDATMFARGPISVSMAAAAFAAPIQASVAPDGSFQFPEVFPGSYSARVVGPGIAPHQPMAVTVTNTDIDAMEIILPGQKEIPGRVIVEGSAPMPRFNFRPPQISRAQRTPLATQFLNIGPAPNGTFRLTLPEGERPLGEINGLPPGYTLKAANYGTTNLLRDPLKISKVDTGELVFTLSASLKPVSVSGKVDGLDPAVLGQGNARVIMASPSYAGNMNAAVRPDGTFEFPSVFPGVYVAQISTPAVTRGGFPNSLPNPREETAAGSLPGLLAIASVVSVGTAGVPVTVADSDIRNLTLSMPRQHEISGRVEIEGGGPIPRFTLTSSAQITGATTSITAFSQPDGTLRFTLPEGERTVRVGQLPAGLSVKSMTYGTADLRQVPLKIDADHQTAELRITLEKTQNQPWVRVAGKVTGLPAEVRNARVNLTGTFNAPLSVPLNSDGTFAFDQVFQGTSSLRLLGNIGETLQPPMNITVGPQDIADLEIVYRR